jgi:isopenicillin N synthase-like dioxygenase
VKYPPSRQSGGEAHGQGVGAHKDSSGWLTLLLQVGGEKRLEVLESNGEWIAAPPIDGTFVVNFGNALEAATDGAVRATVHRVKVRLTATRGPTYS